MLVGLLTVGALLLVILVLCWKIHGHVAGDRSIGTGDIVLYRNPDDPLRMNMITQVLEEHGDDYVMIRARGGRLIGSTTMGASRKHLTKLAVDMSQPLQIPGIPVQAVGRYNEAMWMQIPLSWFAYEATANPEKGNI